MKFFDPKWWNAEYKASEGKRGASCAVAPGCLLVLIAVLLIAGARCA